MNLSMGAFMDRWSGSAGNERANKDAFLLQFCEALDLPLPDPKDRASEYCFEKDVKLQHLDGSTSTGSMDLYRGGCFVLEAKQGATRTSGGSAPVRGTRAYDIYMEKAFGQAVRYARELPERPPFVITCDVGHSFHVWEGFSGTYRGYAARRSFTLQDLQKAEVQDFFRTLWQDPHSLDPARNRARVTRDVARKLGHLAGSLQARFPAEAVSRFLMRCVFTFFAEDTGLLPEKIFESALRGQWQERPDTFVRGLEGLWDAMNTGDFWGPVKVPHFNGGLFKESLALDLSPDQIALLAEAARSHWDEVDPSIFGTLLESALSTEERHRLGAHYTPRADIERLLQPALEGPLRSEWDLVQAEAMAILGETPGEAERARARDVLHAFHARLANTRVLDPACGSGNFLYVAYDLLKGLEQEVFSRLQDLGETRQALALDSVMVTPAQFLGLELKPWAAAIAELVLWIGHLQWYRRQFPGQTPPEPILQRYETIQNRDAVLTWKGTRDTGRTRWDGQTFKLSPVTGKAVPDDRAQVPIVELLEPAPAPWPRAEFIVGNPPFLGNARMREVLGDGYAEALRRAYPDVPDTVDFVLYWWHRAAEEVRQGRARRFGLITTNSLRQVRQRGVIAHHVGAAKAPLKLLWAIPDHPWTDEGAAVRIAMTVGGLSGQPWLGRVVAEGRGETPEQEAEAVVVEGAPVEAIHEDLSAGAKVADAVALKANDRVASPGMKLHGAGFIVDPAQWEAWGRPAVVHPYRNGRDLTDRPRGVMVIDLYGLTAEQVRDRHPAVYQHVFDHVKPERDQNNRAAYRDSWWIYGEARSSFRPALAGLPRYIATVETAKHRVFQFLEGTTVPDNMLIAIATPDAFHLGVLSSRVHGAWAMAAGALMGVGNTPRYSKSRCFDPFPFPEASEAQKEAIRALAERLDVHRKGAQARGVTLTQMYNLLDKLRQGEAFTPKERTAHGAAQTEVLRQLHDDLDRAVLEAYGWPLDAEDPDLLTRLVALNQARAAEEAKGQVRWLRPEYQAPGAPVTPTLLEEAAPAPRQAAPVRARSAAGRPWPRELRDQLAALRDLLASAPRSWTLEDICGAFNARGRSREGIAAHLDLLVTLGVVQAMGEAYAAT